MSPLELHNLANQLDMIAQDARDGKGDPLAELESVANTLRERAADNWAGPGFTARNDESTS